MTDDFHISPEGLHTRLRSGEEIALIDVREQGHFGQGHLLVASNLPLGDFEIRARALIPRLSVTVVLCDADEDESRAGAARSLLQSAGYQDVLVLAGGVQGWADAGYEVFSGINVPSKAFGEFVEHKFETPRIDATVLNERRAAGEEFVILDSRPFEEFSVMSIPGAVDTPGAELVYRVQDLVAGQSTSVIVNCAGRTRSIIGCQSLINAGLKNSVVALKDGTMGWHLAGLALERGSQRRHGEVSAAARTWSANAVRGVAERFAVNYVSYETFERWRAEAAQTSLYVFDVRQTEEYERGHLAGSILAPGGQLVQATDMYLCVRAARLLLVDDTGVRATMTASWLNQLGFANVAVLEGGIASHATETGPVRAPTLLNVPPVPCIGAGQLQCDTDAVVIDVRKSLKYRESHVPDAYWGIRSTLAHWAARLPDAPHYVVVADDERYASYFAHDLSTTLATPVSRLDGGMQAWHDNGFETYTGMRRALSDESDVFHRPYDRESDQEAAMQAYLDWEVALVDQVKRDATVSFPAFD